MADELAEKRTISGGESLDDGDGEDVYVLYKDRSEWSDVQPIQQDEGDEPVVQIEYSQKFNDVYDYFRGTVKLGEKSMRALTLTSDAILLNAANYTVWQYRRDILQALGIPTFATEKGVPEPFNTEFEFSRQMIEENQKNYQVWHHRKILVSWAGGYKEETDEVELKCIKAQKELAKLEVNLTERILEKDAKNYHAWQHRQWVLKTFQAFEGELDYVNVLIEDDVRNNSAWNERHFIISNLPNLTKDDLEREVDYTWDRILSAVSNESPWNYLRGLLQLFKKLGDKAAQEQIEKNLNRSLQHFNEGIKSAPLMGFIVERVSDLLSTNSCPEELFQQALHICDTLADRDSIRKRYWDHIKKRLLEKQLSNSDNNKNA